LVVPGAVGEKMQRRLGVMLGVELHVESRLSEREAKQFALALAVIDQ
jgi:hypothetical protein